MPVVVIEVKVKAISFLLCNFVPIHRILCPSSRSLWAIEGGVSCGHVEQPEFA